MLVQVACGTATRREADKLSAELLRAIADHDVVEQTSRGDLILGLNGEHIREGVGRVMA